MDQIFWSVLIETISATLFLYVKRKPLQFCSFVKAVLKLYMILFIPKRIQWIWLKFPTSIIEIVYKQ